WVRGLSATSRETQFVTGDANIIEGQLLVQYVVKDPAAFLFGVEEPHWLVRKACEAVLTEKVAVTSVDDVLTTAKLEIERYVKAGAQEILDSYGTGIELVAAHIQEVNPPRDVADSFRDVASAREDKNRIIQEAKGYANRVVPMARGDGAALIIAARGDSTEVVNEAQGESDRFRALVAAYRSDRSTIRTRLWLETMDTVLSTVKKYILNDDAGEGELDLRFMEIKR
nr:FtsH protease activity modulator HflK [bacterium]